MHELSSRTRLHELDCTNSTAHPYSLNHTFSNYSLYAVIGAPYRPRTQLHELNSASTFTHTSFTHLSSVQPSARRARTQLHELELTNSTALEVTYNPLHHTHSNYSLHAVISTARTRLHELDYRLGCTNSSSQARLPLNSHTHPEKM